MDPDPGILYIIRDSDSSTRGPKFEVRMDSIPDSIHKAVSYPPTFFNFVHRTLFHVPRKVLNSCHPEN